MTPTPKPQIAAAYSAAADHYDAPALSFWDYFGKRTVKRAAPRPGEMVLDVCCGAGASALPAARAVTPGGRVIGVDLAPPLLALARAKAAARGIANVEFRHADFDQVYFRPESFDAVVCVFGLFFLPDMPAAVRKMWRFLGPGGRLVVTTWGPDAFEPGHTLFWDALRRERPDLDHAYSARKQLSAPGAVEQVFAAAGIASVEVEAEDHDHAIDSPADWWTIVMGSSYRGRVDQLTPEQRERVRAACLALECRALRLPVVYTVARRTTPQTRD
jgi:ubiquinone/menaquinone biosynthesis C-methylase UbiE